MASGADSYLTKPLQSDKLFAEIHMARAVIKARRNGNPNAMPIPPRQTLTAQALQAVNRRRHP